MNTSSSHSPTPSDDAARRDEQLAQLLGELSERLRSGDEVDIEHQCNCHPDLASELRELWGTVMVADAIGSTARSETSDEQYSDLADVIPTPRRLGDYELLEEIGRGGMGVVFLARQINLNRQLAVKMIFAVPSPRRAIASGSWPRRRRRHDWTIQASSRCTRSATSEDACTSA